MTLQINKEDYEKSYLDSMYVISHSKNTTKSYRTRIRLFRKFLSETYQIDEYDLLDHYNKKELDILKIFKDFVIYLDKTDRSARTIHLALSVNKGYLRHMGIKIDSDDLKQVVKVPKVVRIREMPLNKEIILRLLRNAKPKLQLTILMALSTGMRIGEVVQLKISDIDFGQNPVQVYIRANTTKTRQSRETFLTAEAANALKDYLKRYHNWFEGIKDPKVLDKQIFATVSFVRVYTLRRIFEKFGYDDNIFRLGILVYQKLVKLIPLMVSGKWNKFDKYFSVVIRIRDKM